MHNLHTQRLHSCKKKAGVLLFEAVPNLLEPAPPPEREPVMECCLVLTTLSGVTLNVSLSIAKFDRFADLEDHVMDYLISVTDLKVFGCSIEFLHLATQTYLEDPIWDRLQQSKEYCIIFKDCSQVPP